MARQQRNTRLETREARSRLKARADRTPYSHLIHKGLYLDYRKPPGRGTSDAGPVKSTTVEKSVTPTTASMPTAKRL